MLAVLSRRMGSDKAQARADFQLAGLQLAWDEWYLYVPRIHAVAPRILRIHHGVIITWNSDLWNSDLIRE